MVRIAVLGCGRIGRMHAHNIHQHPDTALAAVFDMVPEAAGAAASGTGARVLASADAVFADPEVDAVLIATATETHADFIERAVAAGKAVLCEKPIDLSLARVNACRDRIKGAGVPIQLGFNRRFDPGHRAARDAARSGQIGDLHQVIITSRDPGMPPRSYYEAAGGLLRDMTIHDFDLARFMLGAEPVEVTAIAGRLIDPQLMNELDDYDTAMIIMRTVDGVQCHINNSRAATYGYDQRVELLGTKGMAMSDNRKPHEMRTYSKDNAEISAPYQFFFIERYTEAFMVEIGAFAASVREGTPPEVGFEDGRRALILAEAAYKSIAEGRTVKVEEIA